MREPSHTERAEDRKFHQKRHMRNSATFEPNVPGLGRGLANAEARRYRANSLMETSPADVKEEFARADRGGKGYLYEDELQGMLRTLGTRLTLQRLRGFMEHIAAVRPPGTGGSTGRPYLTLSEFMNNRASFMTLEVPVSKGRATLYTGTSRNIMAGLPPKKVPAQPTLGLSPSHLRGHLSWGLRP